MRPEERIAEVEEFVRYVRVEWPGRRDALQHLLAKRCSNCILSEKCAPLVDGVCAECRRSTTGNEPVVDTVRMNRELGQVLSDHQGKAAGRHDALVMFSGGKDSALLLHALRQQYPRLRLLALMVDNGFTSSVALANVSRVSAIINDIDHAVIKPKESLFRNTFRYALTHLNAGGCYSSVDRLAGDLAFDIGRNTAASLGIPLLIHGGTRAQLHRVLKLFWYETSRSSEKEKRESTGGFELRQIYDDDELKYWWDGSAWPEAQVPRVIFPFYAWQYDEQAVRREVVRLGLIEEGNDNPIVSNYDLLPVNLAVDTFHLGYSGYEPEFAQLIREKKTQRSNWLGLFEAVEYLAGQGMLLPRCIADTLGKLGLSHENVGLPSPAEDRRVPR